MKPLTLSLLILLCAACTACAAGLPVDAASDPIKTATGAPPATPTSTLEPESAPPDAEPPTLAIYLTTDGVTPADVLALANLEAIPLATEPILVGTDFASYDAETHTFTLTQEAEARLTAIDLPVSGRAFVVTVGDERIYDGAFWTPLSSLSYDGITIMLVEGFGSISGDNTHTIDLGCPGPDFFDGPDPRSDPRILAALR